MKAEYNFRLIDNALINLHKENFAIGFPFDTHLQTVCVIAKESGDFDTKLKANKLFSALRSLFAPSGRWFFVHKRDIYLLWDEFKFYKNGVEIPRKIPNEIEMDDVDKIELSFFDTALCGFSLTGSPPDVMSITTEIQKLYSNQKKWQQRQSIYGYYDRYFDCRFNGKEDSRAIKGVFRFFNDIEIKYLPQSDIFSYIVEITASTYRTENTCPVEKDLPQSKNLPTQLKLKHITSPAQRAKLYEQLKRDAYIAEDTDEDCFNWAVGSTITPKEWKPIQWILINEKGTQCGKSNSSVLREFLVLLIYGNVYTKKCSPKHLKSIEKLTAQKLFIGLENKPIILSNAKLSDNKGINNGYSSKYSELRNYIYQAENANSTK